jgi:FAD/FMN-containing dehydrogenase/Fe-S oxidoreductase
MLPQPAMPGPQSALAALPSVLRRAGFRGEIETDRALRAAMSTDNSIYQITPDLVVAPMDSADVVHVVATLGRPDFAALAMTARGGGTGTNGQSLNRGVILDMRRHMTGLLQVDVTEAWAEVEPGIVLDDLNAQLRCHGLFFAPETSTSTRCTVGGMVSTDASGKGSRVYGKTSDNILGLEIARAEGLLCSLGPTPVWAQDMLARAEAAARAGRAAFVANTPRLNRRFTGYDLERACRPDGAFDWWRLFLGAEGTLGPITRIRVGLRRIEAEKRLLVVGFDSFRNALAAATPLLAANPTAIEVMDETVQAIADEAGVLAGLPVELQVGERQPIAYSFIEFNGNDAPDLQNRLKACHALLGDLQGVLAIHETQDLAEIRALWAIRSSGVGLLGKVDGAARPVAFVEDCVVPPEDLPAFVDEFLAVLSQHGLGFGIYGHVDVGCLHIRPALNIDRAEDRAKLVAVSDAVFKLTRKYGGIFWGEHGKGVRGAYLQDWIGPEAYAALQGVKAAFDPAGRFNPGKLVSPRDDLMGIADTPFRAFNAPAGDALTHAFRCNGNAQCLSYAASAPMCPSFKATADLRQSPKGRADALREWHGQRSVGNVEAALESDLLKTLDGCLGCKACASACPVQVDIPTMRSAFLADYHARHRRPLTDRLILMAERHSRRAVALSGVLAPLWPLAARLGQALTQMVDLPKTLAPNPEPGLLLSEAEMDGRTLPPDTILLVQDWFTALFDARVRRDALAGFRALGYHPRLLSMRPAGKAALTLGDQKGFGRMAGALLGQLKGAAACGVPLVGLDPAFVMMLRQDYPKAGLHPPKVLLPQEFLVGEVQLGRAFPMAPDNASARLLLHCTESTADPETGNQWRKVFAALGVKLETPSTGCCGMAGLFGYQKRHQYVSRRLFDMTWRSRVTGAGPVVATGFSCRCQADRLAGQALHHPLGLIADLLQ